MRDNYGFHEGSNSGERELGRGNSGAPQDLLERTGFRPMPVGDGFPPQAFRPPADAFLPPQVPRLLDQLPPSRWTDLQARDSFDQFGNLVRQFNDGNTVVISGNPPNRVIISNDVITKDLTLDPTGRVLQAVEINNLTGFARPRPDCQGAIVDGYGAMHGVNGRVERRNGLISPNERAYVHGLINGFPERWAFLPPCHNNVYRPGPYYPSAPRYTPRYHRGR